MANTQKKAKTKKQLIGDIIFDVVIVAILVFLFVFFITPRFSGNKKSYGKFENAYPSAEWMQNLPDSINLAQINIPGTHDSATQYVKLAFFAKCQSRDIKTQLYQGYRYLDIRLAIDSNADKLKLMHGFCNCKKGNRRTAELLYLDDVLEMCYSFLAENPSETIIFVAKKDNGSEPISEYQAKLNSYIQKNPEIWFCENRVPTLGEVRGKIVLANRHLNEAGLPNAGLNLVWSEQGNHKIAPISYNTHKQENGLTLYVQDRYKYNTNDKWQAFVSGLENTTNTNEANSVYINFLSTSGNVKFGHPIKYAIPLNKKFWALDLNSGNRYGWVIFDYATEELAQKVYMTNF